jgi:hypothetical protein
MLVYVANRYYNENSAEIDRLYREESLERDIKGFTNTKIIFPNTQHSHMEN